MQNAMQARFFHERREKRIPVAPVIVEKWEALQAALREAAARHGLENFTVPVFEAYGLAGMEGDVERAFAVAKREAGESDMHHGLTPFGGLSHKVWWFVEVKRPVIRRLEQTAA